MIADFADFCLVVYVIGDDLWAGLPAWVKPRGEASRCSNSELLTLLVVEECMGWDEETEALSQWRAHRDLFPHLPHRTRFNRRRRRLSDALTLLRQRLLALLDRAQDRQCVRDSLPVPVLGFHLVPGAAGAAHWREHGADYGRVSSKKQTIFGDQLPLLLTLGGVIRDFVLAPASANDVAVAPELLESHTNRAVIGDKGYISAPVAAALPEERGTTRTPPLRRNQHPPRDPVFMRLLNGRRQIIETVNDQLTDQFRIGKNHAHRFAGLRARLASKLTAHTLCIYVNRLLGKVDALQTKCLAFPN